MDEGWIALHRKITKHWVFEDKPYNRAAAWIDILLNVNWKPSEVVIGNKTFTCERGQSLRSLETWAKRWGWNKSATRRFLILLEKSGMIETQNETVTIRITVCKYESYQDIGNGSETEVKRKRNASETEVTLNEQVNKGTRKQTVGEYSPAFAAFWKAYPRKDGSKSKAYQYWKRDKLESKADAVLLKLEAFKASPQWTRDGGQFIPYAQKWLNERRYESEPMTKPVHATSQYKEL